MLPRIPKIPNGRRRPLLRRCREDGRKRGPERQQESPLGGDILLFRFWNLDEVSWRKTGSYLCRLDFSLFSCSLFFISQTQLTNGEYFPPLQSLLLNLPPNTLIITKDFSHSSEQLCNQERCSKSVCVTVTFKRCVYKEIKFSPLWSV